MNFLSFSQLDDWLFLFANWTHLSLCTVLLVALVSLKSFNSYLITLLIVVVVSSASNELKESIFSYVENGGHYFYWYGSFALFDCAILLLLFVVHKIKAMAYSKYARYMSYYFYAFIIVQFLGYLDEIYLGWAFIDLLYRLGVPIMNISITIISLYFLKKEFDFVVRFSWGWPFFRVERNRPSH